MKFIVFLCYKNIVALFALLIATLYNRQRPSVPNGRLLAWIICLAIFEINYFSFNMPFLGQLVVFVGLRFTLSSFSSCIIAIGLALTFVVSWYRRYVLNYGLIVIYTHLIFVSKVFKFDFHFLCDRLETVPIYERCSQAKLLWVLMVISETIVVSLIDGPTITIVLH
ncbi:hypothetical protein ACFX2C_017304 [Malus domestica]